MDKLFYEFVVTDEACTFQFTSVGKKPIVKCVVYHRTNIPGFYNLAMGGLLPDGKLDVEVVSDNGDRNKILATVIQPLFTFLEAHPTDFVFFTGSTPTRTRLYQILTSHELDRATFLLSCRSMLRNGHLVQFEKNNPCIGFLIGLKTNPKKL